MDEAEEVLAPSNKPWDVVHPREEPLNFAWPGIAAQLPPVLSKAFATTPVRRAQLDA